MTCLAVVALSLCGDTAAPFDQDIMAAIASQPPLSLPTRALLPEDVAAREWDKLAAAHELKPVVLDLLKTHVKRIEIFAHISDKELNALPGQGDWASKGNLQQLEVTFELSKLRLTREQLKQQLAALEAGSTKQEEALDEVLSSSELCTLQERFKVVHRFFFTPEQAPSDQTVSRSAREFAKRALSMRELSKVKTQADVQQSGRTKSAPVGGSVDARLVFGAEEKANSLEGLHDVLFRTTILLRAHAIAGIISVGDATEQSQPEEDSTKLRVCPYDVVFKQQCRIERCLKEVPADMQRAWLLRMFDSEQRYWIEQVRDTKLRVLSVRRCVQNPVSDRALHEGRSSGPAEVVASQDVRLGAEVLDRGCP